MQKNLFKKGFAQNYFVTILLMMQKIIRLKMRLNIKKGLDLESYGIQHQIV